MARRKTARRQAAAIRYDPEQGQAPRIVAAGEGELAERIVEQARGAGVPIRTDPGLAGALVGLGIGAEIPPALYAAVAEVLAWVAEVDAERAGRWRSASPPAPSGADGGPETGPRQP